MANIQSATATATTSTTATASTTNNGILQEQLTNEINEFLDARYVSASEASWRIFFFKLHQELPTHQRLAIHTKNTQNVYFQDNNNLDGLSMTNVGTTLMAWFKYNEKHIDARKHLYHNFPSHFVWNVKDKTWKPRQRYSRGTIGRVYAVSPRDSERYFLWILLHNVPGATSFENLRTVEGVLHESNQAACRALGLLIDDCELDACMEEAAAH